MPIKRFSRLGKILIGANPETEEQLFQLDGRLERFTHFWVLVTRQFVRHRCLIRASALSYSTLLALIPMLAVAIGVTSSLLKDQNEDQYYSYIEKFVANFTPPDYLSTNAAAVSANAGATTNLSGVENSAPAQSATNSLAASSTIEPALTTPTEVSSRKKIAHQIRDFVQNTQSGTLGVTGMVVLVFIAISMLSRVEETFNDIWGVARGRNWLWRIVLYWTTITLGPLLLAAAVGLAGSSHLQATKNILGQTVAGNLFFGFIPLVVLWFTFVLVYLLVPNTKVNFSAALVGGIVAGTLWHLNNVFGFLYVSGAVTKSNIYGSLGLLPVFMVGLYMSWLILLFGAQIAYAFQNRAAYLQDKLADNVNQRGREFVALRLMTCLGQRFQNARPPATVGEMSAELAVPSRLTQQVLRTLAAAHLVREVAGAENCYLPARPLETINAHDILLALRAGHGQELPVNTAPALAEIYGEFARIEEAERRAASAISLLALVQRMPAQATLAAPPVVEKQIAAMPADEIISAPEKSEPGLILAENSESQIAPPSAPLEEISTKEKAIRREVVRPSEENEFPL
jgi:membrane protein